MPWNSCAPYVLDESGEYVQAPTGCVAVAISQILYYWNRKAGVPSDYMIRNHTGYVDSFQHLQVTNSIPAPSSNWDSMCQSSYSAFLNPTGADYVSELMIDVGYHADMKYGPHSSGAVTRGSLLGSYGLNYAEYPANYYDWTPVLDNLRDGWPVLMSARSYVDNGETVGHLFIIDAYQSKTFYERNEYVWRKGTNGEWDNGDLVFTESEVQCIDFGDNAPEEGKVVQMTISTYDDFFFQMNWGWNGYNDDTLYSVSFFEGWPVRSYNFNIRPKLFYNIHP